MSNESLKNVDKPFTELFAILAMNARRDGDAVTLAYSSKDLTALYCHICNAVEILLRGFQDLMDLFFVLSQNGMAAIKGYDFWSFFSVIFNLIEALDCFRVDAAYSLSLKNEL